MDIENQEIPEGWQTAELGEITDIIYGVQAAVAQNLDPSIGLPILTNVNITNEGKIDLEKLRYYDLPQKKREALILQKGDLLFNWRSGSQDHVGKTALFDLDGEFTFSSFILRLRTTEKIFNQFLHNYLFYIKANGFFSSKRRQSSINSVFNASVAAKTPIVFPPLPEQKAIAKVLRSVQEAKEARQNELNLERERKNALMDYLFTHGTRGESLKQTEIGEMPESWNVTKLGNHSFKPEYGFTASATHRDTGVKFLRITDLQDGSVNWETVPFCECNETATKKYLLETNDLVFARIGATTGKSYLLNECPQAVFASYLIRVKTKESLIPSFLNYFCQTEFYWQQIDQVKGGKLKGGVNTPILQSLSLPLPKIEEQKEIAEVLQACDEKISALENEINLHDEFFKAMLEELMSGKLSTLNLVE
jgi:type I restriction enzyme S subunit